MKKAALILLMIPLLLGFAACSDEPEDDLEEGYDRVEEAAEEAADRTGDALDEAVDDIEDATN